MHEKIVSEILPRFAQKLKGEGVIASFDRTPFTISISEDWPPIEIVPDLVVHLPEGEKVLVEIANPRDPKRFLGEIVYPRLLYYYKKISAAIVFMLHYREYERVHTRAAIQSTILTGILEKQMPIVIVSWSRSEDVAYRNLKSLLTRPSFLFPPNL